MSLSNLALSAFVAVIAGFVTFLLLTALSLPTEPWTLLVAVLVGIWYHFSMLPRRPL